MISQNYSVDDILYEITNDEIFLMINCQENALARAESNLSNNGLQN